MWQRWINNWWELLSSPQKYYQVSHWPWRVVFSYVVVAALCLGAISATYFNVVEIPAFKQAFNQAQTEVVNHFPSELEVTWNGSNLTTNRQQIETVYYPDSVPVQEWQLPERLAYYLPDEQTDIATVANQLPTSSLAIITPSMLAVTDFQGNWSSVPLSQLLTGIPEATVTNRSLPQQLSVLTTMIHTTLSMIGGFAFIAFPLSILVTRIITAAIDGLLVWFFLRLQRYLFTYGQVLRMSLLITMIASATQLASELLYGSHSWPIFGVVYWGYWLMIVLIGHWHISQLRRQQETDQR